MKEHAVRGVPCRGQLRGRQLAELVVAPDLPRTRVGDRPVPRTIDINRPLPEIVGGTVTPRPVVAEPAAPAE